jgi:hypothetical protein
LPMIVPFGKIPRLAADATAIVKRRCCSHYPTPSLECPTA